MATNQVSPQIVPTFVDPARSVGPTPESSLSAWEAAAYRSNASMDAVLLAFGDTQRYLNSLHSNDKVARIRHFIAEGDITEAILQQQALLGTTLPAFDTDTDPPGTAVRPWGAIWIDTSGIDVYQSNGDGTWEPIFEE